MLLFSESKNSNAIAVVLHDGSYLTYSQFYEQISRISKKINARNLILCCCENDIDSLLIYKSALNANAVPLLLNGNLHTESICNLIDHYQPNYVWIKKNYLMLEDYEDIGCHFEDYILIKQKKITKHQIHDNLAMLLTTSGSTGNRKLVRLSHNNILSNAKSIVEYLAIDENSRAITSLPMNYSYGLSVINSHLYSGGSLVISSKSVVDQAFWKTLKENNVTTLAGVPYTYEMLLSMRFERTQLPSLKKFTQAGGKLDSAKVKKLVEICLENSKEFIVMYGQTEATARISYVPFEMLQKKYDSIGIAIPGGNLWLEDGEGQIITDPGQAGELVFSGENVSLGYADSISDLAVGDVNRGVIRTGDIAKFDFDNYFYITGRKKRFIKVHGNRINLDDVEEILGKEDITAAVSGEDNILKIYIKSDGIQEMDHIKKFISSVIGINASAIKLFILENIPRNESGKIDYSALEGLRDE